MTRHYCGKTQLQFIYSGFSMPEFSLSVSLGNSIVYCVIIYHIILLFHVQFLTTHLSLFSTLDYQYLKTWRFYSVDR